MRSHVDILGWLHVALGVLDLLMAMVLFGLFAGVGVIAALSGEPGATLIGPVLGTVVGGLVAITAIPNFLAGFGLLAWKGWARILALLLALLNGLKFPWGTAFAVYTWWVLMDEEVQGGFR